MINLGDEVKDKVTGFVGIVTGKAEYLFGCVRCAVQSSVKEDKTIPDAYWIDEESLEILTPQKIKKSEKTIIVENKITTPAGPRNDPIYRQEIKTVTSNPTKR